MFERLDKLSFILITKLRKIIECHVTIDNQSWALFRVYLLFANQGEVKLLVKYRVKGCICPSESEEMPNMPKLTKKDKVRRNARAVVWVTARSVLSVNSLLQDVLLPGSGVVMTLCGMNERRKCDANCYVVQCYTMKP